jgi:hypothetical protein
MWIGICESFFFSLCFFDMIEEVSGPVTQTDIC